MRLDGLHHVTCVTGNAPVNVDFYVRVLGLRLVKKTVNQDDPTVYHLFYADESGSPGSDITFFEYPGARPGRAGEGMVHTVLFRVAGERSLDFWHERLEQEGSLAVSRADGSVSFSDPEGLRLMLVADGSTDPPLRAVADDVPAEHALLGFAGVRAHSSDPERSRGVLEGVLGFHPDGDGWLVRGATRGSVYAFDPPPASGAGVPGAGTVHHVAWSTELDEQPHWHDRVARVGLRPSPVIDRFWFRSIYFREPSGVLFELATKGPGFAIDEHPGELGEKLILPPAFEHLRTQIEPILTPIRNPRAPG